MNNPRILFWHRKDLRINDNQALIKAFSLSNAVTSIYILDKNYSHDFTAKSRAWFLGNSLQELGNNWKKLGSRLLIGRGEPGLIIPKLAKTIDAKFVFWNKSIEPYEINRDLEIKKKSWIIDCFKENNYPLEIAEIELSNQEEDLFLPSFISKEITGLTHYSNFNLANNPFSEWKEDYLTTFKSN